MTDEHEKEDDDEYEDGAASSESEEEYENEAEGAEASDESGEDGEDSVASWGYEQKKSRFSKEMLAGFAAIGVLVVIFGIVVYKKMPGAGDSGEVVTAPPDVNLGNPVGSPESSGGPSAEVDPFGEGTENGLAAGGLGPQSEPEFGEDTTGTPLGGGEFNDPNSPNDGSTDFGPDGISSETASLFPNEGTSGQNRPNDPFGSNEAFGNNQPFASNSETENLFPSQPDPGLNSGSDVPFGSSTATDEFGRPLAGNGFDSGASSEFADSTRTDPFGGPDLFGGTGSANPGNMSNGVESNGVGNNDPFPQDNQFAQHEPTTNGSLDNSFPGDPGSSLQPGSVGGTDQFGSTTRNDPFGSTSDSTLTNEPSGSNSSAGNSEPSGLFDRGGSNNPSSSDLSNDPGVNNDPSSSEFGNSQPSGTGNEFGSLDNSVPSSSSTFGSEPSASSSTPFGNEQPFGSSSSSASTDPFPSSTTQPSTEFNSGNGFDSGSGETADLFPSGTSAPVGTTSNDPFQPPLTSSPESSFPSSSASPVSGGPFGNQPFNAGSAGSSASSSPSTSTFDSQPVNAGSYTVQDGDSYWNISKKVYGTTKYFQVLADHNRRTIADPQKMKAGVAIETPPASILQRKLKTVRRTTAPAGLAGRIEPSGRADRSGSAASRGSVSSAAESVVVSRLPTQPNESAGILFNEQGYPLFRIGKTDTLTSIASDHLGRASRWQQVYNMNRDQLQSPDKLQIGMLLKLPADASRVPLVDRTSSLR
jgi:LysM repeat protein